MRQNVAGKNRREIQDDIREGQENNIITKSERERIIKEIMEKGYERHTLLPCEHESISSF